MDPDTNPDSGTRHAMKGLDLAPRTRNVLVLAPTHGGHWKDTCSHFHTRPELDDTNVLVVTYVLGATDHLSRFEAASENAPEAVAVVETTGDATTSLPTETEFPVELRHESPSDLTGIGIQCSEFLTRWHESGNVSICFESITSMLQYTQLKTAYRFLHVLTHRVNHADATAHYHMSPDAHSPQELGTVKQLFDAVATFDENSAAWDVVQR